MRLQTTVVGLLVVVAVVLSGTIYYGFALHKDDIVSEERQQVETTADVVATDIESQIQSRGELVDLWADNTEITADNTTRRSQSLARFVDRTPFNGGSVVLANGTMAAFRSESLTPEEEANVTGENFSSRAYVRAALNGTTYVSEPFGAESGTRIIAVSTPIARDGEILGVLTGSLHVENGGLFENAATLGRSTHWVEITAGGQQLFSERPASTSGSNMTASAAVEGAGLTVTASQSRSEFAGEIQDATVLQFGGVALALLAIGAIGVWISRSTIRQLDALVEGLDELESGAYGRQLDLSTADEWGAISDSYNDLSDTLQQRESQLQVLNRVLRHNLRNDMNVVTAYAESALARPDTPEDVAEDIEKIHATAGRLLSTSDHARTLYEDLLSGGITDLEPVDVTEIVARQVATLRSEFPESTIQADVPPEATALDTTILPIVIEEIVHNALVHNDRPESERTVAVTVKRQADSGLAEAGEVQIVVTDNGPGIPMVEEALLTDELEETPIEHGSGLGVWLVNWLVDQLGGTVEVYSGIERGATVTIRAPAAPDDG